MSNSNSDTHADGLKRFFRTTRRDDADVYPILVWFAISQFIGAAAGHIGKLYYRANGYTGKVPVEISGGGDTTTVYWDAAAYQAFDIHAGVFVTIFLVFVIRDMVDERRLSEEYDV